MSFKSFSKPNCPQAHAYVGCFCEDSNCGLHIIAYDAAGEAIVEIVLSAEKTLELMTDCKDFLYAKAALGDKS